ncbi:MAG TPA: phosphotransferase [Candidatus Limnocylindria bacterium]|nr:phosphotransferase [Candidatus Limnocylindria bacterium]
MSANSWTDRAAVDAAHAWLRETVAEAGHRVTGPITQPHVRPWSTVFRAPTDGGDVYLKLCGPSQAHEPALTTLLAAERPAIVPRILGVHPDEPWMLLADGGAKLRDVLDGPAQLGVWTEILPPYAELQRALLGREDAIRDTGTPDHGLDRLLADFRGVLDDERILAASAATFEAAARRRLRSLLPEIERQAAELATSGVGSTAQHDDLHDANVLVRDGTAVVFDWGDASLTHPFLSLGVLLEFSAERAGVAKDHPSIVRVRDAYLEPWTALLQRPALVEAAGLGARLASLTRALSWHRVVTLIPAAMEAEPGMMGQYLSQVVDAFSPGA